MFGYIVLSSRAEKEDKKIYREAYCGLCHTLKEKYGKSGMVSISYDMTFLTLLLGDLLSQERTTGKERCPVHMLKEHDYFTLPIMAYTSDMQILLTYYSILDSIHDEGKGRKRERRYSPMIPYLEEKYPRQSNAIKTNLALITEEESKNSKDIDKLSRYFGELLGEIFINDENNFFKDDLFLLGCNLGKFIYIIDAWDDRKKDKKNHAFNPLGDDIKEETVESILMESASSAAMSYTKLPLDEYTSILDNIIYSGMWTKFYKKKEKNR